MKQQVYGWVVLLPDNDWAHFSTKPEAERFATDSWPGSGPACPVRPLVVPEKAERRFITAMRKAFRRWTDEPRFSTADLGDHAVEACDFLEKAKDAERAKGRKRK